MVAAEVRQRVTLRVRVPPSQSPSGEPYQDSAHMSEPCADGQGRLSSPQVDRREVRPHLCTRRAGSRVRTREAGTTDAVVKLHHAAVELCGQGPLASSPRFEMSPCPSAPSPLLPQHLTVASSCGEEQPRITDRLRISIDMWTHVRSMCCGGMDVQGVASLSPKGFRHADPQRGA